MTTHYLTPEELSERWYVTKHTLGQWRWNGIGPAYTKFGRSILYDVVDVEAFETERRRRHTSEK